MKKNKAISLLLSMSLIASLAMPNTLALSTYAADTTENSGMVINKTAEKNAQGGYTISLEAYATGSKDITEVTKTFLRILSLCWISRGLWMIE